MGDMADMLLGSCDPYDCDDGDYSYEPKPKVCAFCKCGNLYWMRHNNKWVLGSISGVLHVCKPNKKDLKAFPPL